MLSTRFEGLKLLKECGVPTPDWIVVESVGNIASLSLPDTEFGWTVRTCRSDGKRETGGFFRNQLGPQEVVCELGLRAPYLQHGEFYVVYPSWLFLMSFNVLLADGTYIFEGKRGSQKGISIGTELPEFSVRVPFGMLGKQVWEIGQTEPETAVFIPQILRLCRRIPWAEFYAEVAVTTRREMIFYELFPLERKRSR